MNSPDDYVDAVRVSIHAAPCVTCEKITHRQDRFRDIAVCRQKCWLAAKDKYPIQRNS